jgi:ATP-dependent helicase HrpB
VLVMTEAIFVATILDDPELTGVSAVLFDEAHERHLDSDLGLALALESQAVVREDLRVLVMSATINGARFARLLGDGAPVIESAGKAHPLAIRWIGSRPELRVEDAMASAILTALREEAGCPPCRSCRCMARSNPPPSARRSGAIRKAAAGSCWLPPLPRHR